MIRSVFPTLEVPDSEKLAPDETAAGKIFVWLTKLIKPMSDILKGRDELPKATVPAIVMYDTAGEWTNRPWWTNDFFWVLRDTMDVLAVVIDPTATDFPKTDGRAIPAAPQSGATTPAVVASAPPPKSLRETLNILHQLKACSEEIRPVVCVLVTKVDVPASGFDPLTIASANCHDETVNGGGRGMLLDALRRGGNCDAVDVKHLCSLISDTSLVKKVFFTWTEDITGGSGEPGTGNPNPRSHNLGHFLAWCLEQDRNPSNPAD